MNKKNNIKNEIIIKTREIISKMGYKKTSTEEIARALNRTKGALYHYFDNREEILQAVIKYEGEEIISFLNEAIEQETEPGQKLYAFFYNRAKKVFELWNFYQSVMFEYFNRYSFIMQALNEYSRDALKIIKEIIAEGMEQKVFTTSNATVTAQAFLKAMQGFDFFIFQGDDFTAMEDEIKECLRILIKGLQ